MNPETTQVHSTLPSYTPLLVPQDGVEKGPTPLLPGRVAIYPGYNTMQYNGGLLPNGMPPQRRRSRTRRFLARAVHTLMLLAVFIWLFPVVLRGVSKFARSMTGPRGSFDIDMEPPELPDECVQVADWTQLEDVPHLEWSDVQDASGHRQAAQASLTLPASSDVLYFMSKGSLSNGVIRIIDDGDDGAKEVKVDITFVYHSDHMLDLAKVCRLHPQDSHNGVGIFTPPRHRHHHHHTHSHNFYVEVHLPSTSHSSPLKINDFRTNMPLFFHTLSDLGKSVHFNSLGLHTSNMGIYAESVTADTATVTTSNGQIIGNFTVHETLDLHTSNSPIVANVTMLHNGKDKAATHVSMKSSNAFIHSNVSLIADTHDKTGGSFDVIAKTSNSPVELNFTTAPVDSLLHLDAHSSNSPVRATLDNTYEGSFALRTSSWFPVQVEVADKDAKDPAGRGRKRQVELHSIWRGTAEGKAVWTPEEEEEEEEEEKELGRVTLTTSNSPVALYL